MAFFVDHATAQMRLFTASKTYIEVIMKRNTYRIPIGFLAAALFLLRAEPTIKSLTFGALIMATGEIIRFISAGTLIKFEGVTRRGIYAFSRNPLYLGSFLIGLGACVAGHDTIFTLVFIVAYPLIYIRLIKREEAYLIGRYGAPYELYLKEVPRLVPNRFSFKRAFGEQAAFLAIKNREYKTIFGVIAIWAVLATKMASGML